MLDKQHGLFLISLWFDTQKEQLKKIKKIGKGLI